jgi:uncharacterized protein YcaQ
MTAPVARARRSRRPRRGSLSLAEARRITLAAQGFADPAPGAGVDRRHLRRVLGRVGMIQMDSVNVLVRSHYLPPFSRLGPYPRELLDRMAYALPRELFEYWGHEASLIPMALHPLLRWRMARGDAWGGMLRVSRERPDYVRGVLAEVAERGPIGSSELSDPGVKRGPWWGWADGKRALEWLYWTGRLATAERRNFQRLYDLPERVIPAEVLSAPTPPEDEARRELLRLAARSLGVGTAADLADYVRLTVPEARPRIAELVEGGSLEPVSVEGWTQPAFLDPEVRLPRQVDARALLSPFDSLVWFRPRVARLFGMEFRLEVYVPAPGRRWGYYVLPLLLGDRLAGRVDLKADRKERTLLVQAAYAEPEEDRAEVAAALAAELGRMAGWLGLERVLVRPRGDLAPALARTPGMVEASR